MAQPGRNGYGDPIDVSRAGRIAQVHAAGSTTMQDSARTATLPTATSPGTCPSLGTATAPAATARAWTHIGRRVVSRCAQAKTKPPRLLFSGDRPLVASEPPRSVRLLHFIGDPLLVGVVLLVGSQDLSGRDEPDYFSAVTWLTMTVAQGGGIFVSYRRQETSHLAGRLYDRLADRFGEGQVFIDVDTIEPGVDFAEEIFRAVAACKVLLAIIGPNWLTATDERGGRRLDDPDDIVRLEIEAALARGVRVIPILVEGAVMPSRQDLPESLAGLVRRNALLIRHESFRYDAGRLMTAIEPILAPAPGIAAVMPQPSLPVSEISQKNVREDSQAIGDLRAAVDIVFCIDVTGSMNPVIQEVKNGAFSFHAQLSAVMRQKGKSISQLRIRVIAYRDFKYEPEDALQTSPFFRMPGQAKAFESFVRALSAGGGGDEPESGLEALAAAIESKWERSFEIRRHIIVIFTDASAHRLGGPERSAAQYPKWIPSSLDELTEKWGDRVSQTSVMEHSAKRLLMFAPEVYPWNTIGAEWDNVLWFPSRAGGGLQEIVMTEILDILSSSV